MPKSIRASSGVGTNSRAGRWILDINLNLDRFDNAIAFLIHPSNNVFFGFGGLAGGVDVDGTALLAVVAVAVHGFENISAVLAKGDGSTSARVVSVISVLVSSLSPRGSSECGFEERLESWDRAGNQGGVDFDLRPDENVGTVVWDITRSGPDVESVDTSARGNHSNATNREDTNQSN